MNIRVAYDISTLAEHFAGFHPRTGVYRVVEELLGQLQARSDIEVRPTSLCSDDPVLHSVLGFLYLESRHPGWGGSLAASYRSRFGLSHIPAALYRIYFTDSFQARPKFSAKSVLVRVPLRAARHLPRVDARRMFNSEAVDVFHSPFFRLPPRDLTGKLPRVLTIYDLIPVNAPDFIDTMQAVKFREVLASIDVQRDWVACISEYTKEEFCDYTGMPEDRVFVTPLAAADHFHPLEDPGRIAAARQCYGLPEGDYFLSISRLETRKNLAHLIECFFRFRAENPGVRVQLVLVGEKGWMHEEIISAAIGQNAFRSDIVFTGYVPDHDLSAVYNGATAFVYPSLYEGFGLPPLEAMQCGVPVITSNSSSLPEVVGEAGILLDPRDMDAMCDAMLAVLNDPMLRETLRARGLQRAQQFSWARCAAQTIEAYRTAVANP